MQVKLEPRDDAEDEHLLYNSRPSTDDGGDGDNDDQPHVKREAGSASSDDDDDDDDDDEFEEVGADGTPDGGEPSNAPLASRQADLEEHPALILQRQREAEAAAAAAGVGGEASGERPVYKDGKGGNKPIEVQLALAEEASSSKAGSKKRTKTYTPAEREAHLNAHKIHLVALLASASSFNRQSRSPLLQARLLSLLPPHLLAAFDRITPAVMPSRTARGRAFERALETFVEWWAEEFEVDWRAGIRYRAWASGEAMGEALAKEKASLTSLSSSKSKPDRKGKGRATEVPPPFSKADKKRLEAFGKVFGGELLRSHKSLQKKALNLAGSRDISAALFVSVARALGIGVRLVVSLQPVGWRMGDGAVTGGGGKGKGKGKATTDDSDAEDLDMEAVPLPSPPPKETHPATSASTAGAGGSGGFVRWIDRLPGQRVPGLKASLGHQLDGFGAGSPAQASGSKKNGLGNPATGSGSAGRRSKGKGRKVGEKEADANAPFDVTSPPVLWAEVFSRPDQEWIPVDPVRGFIRRARDFEPKGTREVARNRMVYVLGLEEDDTVKDLTPKYCENFDKALKQRVPVLKSRFGDEDFWADLVRVFGRAYKLDRDVKEDDLLQRNVKKKAAAMPTTMEGFKNHPDYVLERHIKSTEVIYPKVQTSMFKGEPVYKRSNVLAVKTAENWLRQGREVVSDEQPLKWGKVRAMTTQRQRAVEAERERLGGEEVKQPLYAENQTRLVRPPAIKNGQIPRNQYGNMDLFVPTMLPPGAIHLKLPGVAKVAKKLEISYADACVGFEFKQKQRKAIPQLLGVVVAEENAALLQQAWEENELVEAEKFQRKQKERVLKRWERLITGLKIRRRMQREYGDGQTAEEGITVQMDLGVQPHEMPSPDKHIHALPLPGVSSAINIAPDLLHIARVKREASESTSRIDDSAGGGGFTGGDSSAEDEEEENEDDDGEVQIVEKALNPRSLASLHAHADDGDGSDDESDVDGERKPERAPFASPTTATAPPATRTPRVVLRRPTAGATPRAGPARRSTRASTSRATHSRANFASTSSSARKRARSSDDDDAASDDSSVVEVKVVHAPATSRRPQRAAAAKGQLKMQAIDVDDDETEDEIL